MPFKQIEEYKTADGSEVTLERADDPSAVPQWRVSMWTPVPDPDFPDVDPDWDCHWQLTGWHEGGVDNGGLITGSTWHHYTEETARKEFERWR